MKTFYCAEDIEKLAAQGKSELILDENAVLTDLARDTAQRLGMTLRYGVQARPGAAALASPVRSVPTGPGAKPKGCQHGPLGGGRPRPAGGPDGSGGVVDQLVGLVRQLGNEPA